MKNSLLLTSALSLLLVVLSCGEDDGPKLSGDNYSLEGTLWNLSSNLAENCDATEDNERNDVVQCTTTDCEQLLLQAGTITITNRDFGTVETTIGTYVLSGDTFTVTIEEDNEEVVFPVKFFFTGDILNLSYNFPPTGCDVTLTYEPA